MISPDIIETIKTMFEIYKSSLTICIPVGVGLVVVGTVGHNISKHYKKKKQEKEMKRQQKIMKKQGMYNMTPQQQAAFNQATRNVTPLSMQDYAGNDSLSLDFDNDGNIIK